MKIAPSRLAARRSILMASLAWGLVPAVACAGEAATPVERQPIVLKAQAAMERPRLGQYMGEPGIDPALLTEGFLSAHPDLRWRREGLYSYNKRDFAIAMNQFKRAARYADKPSQAMIAEMYWKGIGVPQDKPIAYAWMDLAAERLYPNFLLMREDYWNALDASSRREAIERGQPLLAEYGDDAAKPRMVRLLNLEKAKITGSHLGNVAFLEIMPLTGPLAGTGMRIPGDQLYAQKYWQPDKYFQWQDRMWNAPSPKTGKVDVGIPEDTSRKGAGKRASTPP